MKLLIVSILSCLFMGTIQAYDALVNLGGDCQPAAQMYFHGIREYALPFDALITPCESLPQILEEQFSDFLNIENLSLETYNDDKYILDKKYNIRLIHDFTLEENFLDNYEAIKEKYERRIKRLFTILEQSESILFIRKGIMREQAELLESTIVSLYPDLDFIILALDGTEEIKKPWGLERVINRFLRQPDPYVWKGDPQAWKALFLEMGLELFDAQASTDEH